MSIVFQEAMTLHEEIRASTKKRVSFDPFVAVRKIIPLKGTADLWYKHQDFHAMKNQIRRTIICCKMKRDGKNVSMKGICSRGLEEHIMENPQVIRERRMKTALIVLLEHDRQQDEDGITSSEKMAARLKGISQYSADRARRKALYDESVARKIYNHSPPIISSTETSRTRLVDHRDTNPASQVAYRTSSPKIYTARGDLSSTHLNVYPIIEKGLEKATPHSEISRFLTSTSLVSANLLLGIPTRSFQSHARA